MVMNGLNREIERALAGEPARVFFKMNSLTDREIIDKIAEASQAGVEVQMIIRGISCLLPGIPGKTENVHIRSIVGRFLEHARVYSFGVDSDIIYLSSADMMTRNTEHRVEIAYPVLDPACRELVQGYMQAQLTDNVKARTLSNLGAWEPVQRTEDEQPFNSQEFLLEQAYRKAQEARTGDGGPKRAKVALGARENEAAVEMLRTAEEETRVQEEAAEVTGAPAREDAAAPIAEATTQPAPKEEISVQATLIEPPAEGEDVQEPAEPAATKAAARKTTLAKRQPGRLRQGLALIGLGIKTLIAGAPDKR